MNESIAGRVPVVSSLAYSERLSQQPSSFRATLIPEQDNRYQPRAIAVTVDGEKVGYVAPEVARQYWDAVVRAGSPVSCQARRASRADHETSGVELLLDFSEISASV